MRPKTPADNKHFAISDSAAPRPGPWRPSLRLHNAALLIAVLALSYTADYQFPPRGQVSLQQASLLTPTGLWQNAYPEILSQPTTRLGIFDDVALFALWIIVISLSALRLRRESSQWRM